MALQIHFYDAATGRYIKDWPNWSGPVPQTGDTLLLHYGDDHEEERRYTVARREISGTRPDSLRLYISEK